MLKNGIYEKIISNILNSDLESLRNSRDIQTSPVDPEELPRLLAAYLSEIIKLRLEQLRDQGKGIDSQISIVGSILRSIMSDSSFDPFVPVGGKPKMLLALSDKKPQIARSAEQYHLSRPLTSISQSSLFTGALREPSMYSELRKEIASSDRVDILVSFIKWSGLRLLIDELKKITDNGGRLRVITTTYLGVTDIKSVEALSQLQNTEIKISYDTKRTRLHAKTYVFQRESGFSTAYVGSSNLSNAAISSGLEWNVKITARDLPDAMEKINRTFESYWNSEDFEIYSHAKIDMLKNSLLSEKFGSNEETVPFIPDIHPYAYQKDILDKLSAERSLHNRNRNLIVAATGTGKTVVSAMDYRRFCLDNPGKPNRLLFVAHREDILRQSLGCFRSVLKDYNFGDLNVGSSDPQSIDHIFISIQMVNSRKLTEITDPSFYDYIIVDEFHHAPASSYQPLLTYYKPKILLGLTATPERMDGQNILQYFDNHIAAEIRLPEAINRKFLSPFQYFIVTDSISLKTAKWSRGGYDRDYLSGLYSNGSTASMERASLIVDSVMKYTDIGKVKGIGFCVSKAHCKFMSDQFNSYGIESVYLTSDSSEDERRNARFKLTSGVKFVFVVDLYNEGVDIPEINTILFLRPTESLTVFIQQLGRGLRISDNKDCLTVLDFVGQANANYSFEKKFTSILSSGSGRLEKEMKEGFPNVPAGCYIQLEKKAEEYILNNITKATGTRSWFISKISAFSSDTGQELNLKNFIEFYGVDTRDLYNKHSFSRLKVLAGISTDFNEPLEPVMTKAFSRICSIDSRRWINFLISVIDSKETLDYNIMKPEEKRMINMFQYTVWQKSYDQCGFSLPEEGILKIRKSGVLFDEILELLKYNLSSIDFIDRTYDAGFESPLDVYCSYTRDQILVAMDFMNPQSVREGVKYLPGWNTEILFVTLNKSEKDYTPSTLYRDYSISDSLFHWQSQSTTSEESKVGQRLHELFWLHHFSHLSASSLLR